MQKKSLLSFCLYLMIFLIAGSIGCFIRFYPLRHFTSNDAWDKASFLVLMNALQSVHTGINPLDSTPLSPEQKELLAAEQLNAILFREKAQARQAILRLARAIDKETPPRQQFPYLLASDSYYFYDLTRTIIRDGRMSPQIKGSKYFHPKMTAPDGYWEPLTLHPYMGLITHKIFSFFRPDIDLMFSVSFTSMILLLFTLIIFLILASQLNISKWATLIAGCLFVCAQILLKRSVFAWYDNDIYNVLFPMLIMMILAFSFQRQDRRGKLVAGISLALALILYTLFWQGWMFMAVILLVSGCLIMGTEILFFKKKGGVPYHHAVSLIVFLSGMILIMGWNDILILFQEGWQALSGFLNTKVSVWPDTYIAVGELRKASPGTVIELTGGPVLFIGAVWGLIVGLIRIMKNGLSPRRKLVITAGVFAAASFIITLGAQRFALLCITPFTILFLLGMDALIKIGTDAIFIKKKSACPYIFAFLAAIIIIPTAIHANTSLPEQLDPIYNDTWHEALTYIREHTPKDAIVNSWWPPGHFIKAIAERRVTIDGATINNRQAYWMAKALLAQTEDEALDYFRLINNSGNQAINLLLDAGLTNAQTASFLNHIIHLPEPQAREAVQYLLNDKAEQLLALTHGPTEPSYFLLYNEMIQKFILYPFVARWNMEKAEEINRSPLLQQNIPSARSPEYITFLWSMAGGYPRVSDLFSPTAERNNVLIFQNLMIIDLNTKTCRIDSAQYGRGIPAFLFYQDGDEVIKKPLPGANLPYSVVIGRRHEKYEAMLAETPIAGSLLTRLYFFGDAGLTRIKRMSQHANLTRQMQIDVFRIAE